VSIIPTPAPGRLWARLSALGSVSIPPWRAVEARLEAQDHRADERGWTITRGARGRRTYRDPRFDGLAARRLAVAEGSL
jgi:hypothetical protein